jgi:hypothetical protein
MGQWAGSVQLRADHVHAGLAAETVVNQDLVGRRLVARGQEPSPQQTRRTQAADAVGVIALQSVELHGNGQRTRPSPWQPY